MFLYLCCSNPFVQLVDCSTPVVVYVCCLAVESTSDVTFLNHRALTLWLKIGDKRQARHTLSIPAHKSRPELTPGPSPEHQPRARSKSVFDSCVHQTVSCHLFRCVSKVVTNNHFHSNLYLATVFLFPVVAYCALLCPASATRFIFLRLFGLSGRPPLNP